MPPLKLSDLPFFFGLVQVDQTQNNEAIYNILSPHKIKDISAIMALEILLTSFIPKEMVLWPSTT